MRRLAILLSVFLGAAPAMAAPLTLSLLQGAAQTETRATQSTDYRLLTGPWTVDGGAEITLVGRRVDTAWQIAGDRHSTLELLTPLQDQITAAGYTILYSCETDICGGFDFRYALDLLPEPEMHVDLGDFRYIAARRGNEWLALTVSRSTETGFIHLTTLSSTGLSLPQTKPAASPDANEGDFAAQLETQGHVALDDLAFESGDATLLAGDYASLVSLSNYLASHPDARIALVGHTDATGSLEANVALSKQRAETVLERLQSEYGIRPGRLTSEGVGWLAPRASNETDAGRMANRRVEAVLLSTGG